MSKNFVIAAVQLAALLFAGAIQAAGDIEAGKAKSAICAGCHGANGVSSNPLWPNLAGQVPGYIAKQLADFKSGARKDPTMAGFAAGLSEADMADLDAYFASLAPNQGAASDEELAKKGEHLYRGGNKETGVAACMGCHSPTGGGIPPRFPRVAGQHAAYAEKQLLAFKSGQRANDNEVMTKIAFFMSEQEIKAVADYMQGLRATDLGSSK
jgi:cytochrome c553